MDIRRDARHRQDRPNVVWPPAVTKAYVGLRICTNELPHEIVAAEFQEIYGPDFNRAVIKAKLANLRSGNFPKPEDKFKFWARYTPDERFNFFQAAYKEATTEVTKLDYMEIAERCSREMLGLEDGAEYPTAAVLRVDWAFTAMKFEEYMVWDDVHVEALKSALWEGPAKLDIGDLTRKMQAFRCIGKDFTANQVERQVAIEYGKENPLLWANKMKRRFNSYNTELRVNIQNNAKKREAARLMVDRFPEYHWSLDVFLLAYTVVDQGDQNAWLNTIPDNPYRKPPGVMSLSAVLH